MASNNRVLNEVEWLWNQTFVAKLKILWQNLSGGTEENEEVPQSG